MKKHPTHDNIVTAVLPLLESTKTAMKFEHGLIAQEKLQQLQEAGASQEAIDAVDEVMRSIYGFAPETPAKTTADLQRETLASLALYISRHTWTQLTTEQKECLADAIDAEGHAQEPEFIGPVDRWWRD